jgi:hypothetical protein
MQLSTASAISLKLTRSMSGMARRIADTLEPETKPVRKPASSISRAPIPSPQPGITCSRGSSRSAFSAAAGSRIFFPLVGWQDERSLLLRSLEIQPILASLLGPG